MKEDANDGLPGATGLAGVAAEEGGSACQGGWAPSPAGQSTVRRLIATDKSQCKSACRKRFMDALAWRWQNT